MIRRLRIRIILSAIATFALVIFFISVLVNVINYRMVTEQADETLTSIIDFESRKNDGNMGLAMGPREMPIPPFMGMMNPEAEYITRFFIVRYDDQGMIREVLADNIAEASREEAYRLAEMTISKGKNRGYIDGYRFLKGQDKEGKLLAFLNVMQDQQRLKVLKLVTGAVAVLSLLIVSILVIIFSAPAIKPIVQNIEQQKRFITDASHELKTPLTSIVTSLDVLALENGENEWTENIRNQSARMTKLVGELVALSRLDEAKPLYQKEEFSVSDISWEMLEIYQGNAKAKDRTIRADIEENLVLYGDKSAVGQMISVLMDNAIKYSKGKGDICYRAVKEHNKVIIELSNPTDYPETIDVNRLFDRFYRPDSSRNVNDGGSGIGLAIAKAVVEAHGGKITAKCPGGKQMIIKVRI